jgi:hypothetical protein
MSPVVVATAKLGRPERGSVLRNDHFEAAVPMERPVGSQPKFGTANVVLKKI